MFETDHQRSQLEKNPTDPPCAALAGYGVFKLFLSRTSELRVARVANFPGEEHAEASPVDRQPRPSLALTDLLPGKFGPAGNFSARGCCERR